MSQVDSSPGSRRLRLPEQPLARHLLFALVAGALLFWLTFNISGYDNTELAQIGWFAVAIAGLSVLTGVSGQISLGHGAFMAVGAYAAGIMMEHYDLPLVVPIVVAVVVSAVLGALVGIPATRLRGPYLAGVTLALALAVQDLPAKFSSLFNGDQGIIVNQPTPPSSVPAERWLAWITLGSALLAMVILANFLRSRFGRALRAVRDDEVAAAASGLHPARLRVLAFAVSAAAAGLAGGLFALWSGIVSPNSFSLFLSIQLLAGMVVGGSGSLVGAWWGALALVYIPEWSTSLSGHFNFSSGVSANLQNAVFGLLIIAIMMLAPSGIQGWLKSVWARLRHLTRRRGGVAPGTPVLSAPPVSSSPTPIPTPERTIP
ncbi:MAG: branched-chain amino acid ABC transporter permease [Acidimicrobiales bacterium]